MRILLITHRFPPALGGVESWAEALATGLTGHGHDVLVFSRDDSAPASHASFTVREEQRGSHRLKLLSHRHADERRFRDSWHDPRLREPLLEAIRDFRPDLIHIAHNDGWGVVPFRLADEVGLPTVVTLHDYKWVCARGQMVRPPGLRCERVEEDLCVRCVDHQIVSIPARSLLRSALGGRLESRGSALDDRRPVEARSEPGRTARHRWRSRQRALLAALRSADLVTAPSRFVAERLQQEGLDREIQVIPNGMGPPTEHEELEKRSKTRSRTGPLRVGVFGRPHPSKGFDFLATAFQSLPEGAASLELHGVTGTELAGTLPPQVEACGHYAPEEVAQRMAGVDVVAIPSLWDENHPMVAVEALRARRPLVVSDLGGLPELVRHDVDGWVVPAGNAEAWGEQLALLAADPQRVERCRRALPAPHSAASMAGEFEKAYLQLGPG